MTSAWAKIQPITKTISFDEITAEEMAKSIQKKEFEEHGKTIDNLDTLDQCICYELDATDSDAVIAQLLQNQYNSEYDLMLKKTEEKFNGHSKVGISYANYRISSTNDPDERKVAIDDENRDLDRFVNVEKEYASIPKCGYKKNSEGSEIVTKHDMLMSSRMNACRVLEFPPGISTGDTGGFDVKLNNRVFNSLRAHSYAYCSRKKSKPKAHNK
ncbi:serine/threonine-protein kinase RIO3 [Diachasma alloeum]|uniref:serine/threonine-protein kinase RIO3 n=1 Tax=Diachasma alloeum TaxID=454923 RepID=UPI0007383D2F|nr:serine/threonine-protein kinase RIO3 [Diachasma alloeum]